MPQNDCRVTAPTDPDPKWPEGYVAVLREAGAKEKTIPFCIGWVRRFFSAFPGRKRRDLGRAEIERFLSEIAARPESGNWLVQQARDALELYYEKFRGIALAPREFVPANHTLSPVRQAPPAEATPQTDTTTHPFVGIQNTREQYTKPLVSVKGGTAGPRAANLLQCERAERLKLGEKRDRTLNAQRLTPNAQVGEGGEKAGDGGVPAPKSGASCNWKVLEERLRDVLRTEHYAYATEKTYVGWVRRYVAFHGWRKPSTLEAEPRKRQAVRGLSHAAS